MVTAAIFGLLVLLMFLGIPIAASMALTSIVSFLALSWSHWSNGCRNQGACRWR